jgi:hypothetical protein
MNALVPNPSSGVARWFYVWVALVCVAFGFGGFFPSYFAKLAGGRSAVPPILHIHGIRRPLADVQRPPSACCGPRLTPKESLPP